MNAESLRQWGATPPGWLGPRILDEIAAICGQVSAATGVEASALFMSRRGPQFVARARQTAMALVRERCQLSFADIGETFAHRDHATVIHAVKRQRNAPAVATAPKDSD